MAALRLSRNQALLAGIAVFAIAFAAVVALTLGPRAWDQFSRNDLQLGNKPAPHFTDFAGSGRRDFWRVAIDDFEDHPLLGDGAGSYEFTWEQRRSIDLPVKDAHSLYLESFAELGLVGGLLVLGLVGSLLVICIRAWRSASGLERERLRSALGGDDRLRDRRHLRLVLGAAGAGGGLLLGRRRPALGPLCSTRGLRPGPGDPR